MTPEHHFHRPQLIVPIEGDISIPNLRQSRSVLAYREEGGKKVRYETLKTIFALALLLKHRQTEQYDVGHYGELAEKGKARPSEQIRVLLQNHASQCEVTLLINSPGGSESAAAVIRDAIKQVRSSTAFVGSMAGSAAAGLLEHIAEWHVLPHSQLIWHTPMPASISRELEQIICQHSPIEHAMLRGLQGMDRLLARLPCTRRIREWLLALPNTYTASLIRAIRKRARSSDARDRMMEGIRKAVFSPDNYRHQIGWRGNQLSGLAHVHPSVEDMAKGIAAKTGMPISMDHPSSPMDLFLLAQQMQECRNPSDPFLLFSLAARDGHVSARNVRCMSKHGKDAVQRAVSMLREQTKGIGCHRGS